MHATGESGTNHRAKQNSAKKWVDAVNYNRGFISGFYDDETGRFNIYNCDIIESDHTVLITPWAQYKASPTKAGQWGVRKTWGEGNRK